MSQHDQRQFRMPLEPLAGLAEEKIVQTFPERWGMGIDFAEPPDLLLVRGVHQHQPRHVAWKFRDKAARKHPAQRMAGQNVRRLFARGLEHVVQIGNDFRGRLGFRRWVALAQAGAIVAAYSREAGYG